MQEAVLHQQIIQSLYELDKKLSVNTQKTDDGFVQTNRRLDIANGRTAKVEAQADDNRLKIALFNQAVESIKQTLDEFKEGGKAVRSKWQDFGFAVLLIVVSSLISGIIGVTSFYFTNKSNEKSEETALKVEELTAQLNNLELIQYEDTK